MIDSVVLSEDTDPSYRVDLIAGEHWAGSERRRSN